MESEALPQPTHRAPAADEPSAPTDGEKARAAALRDAPDPDVAYPWPRAAAAYEPLAARFQPPSGAERIEAAPGSYGHWLRHLPLRPTATPVRSYAGRTILAANDARLAAVVDLDLIGTDLQQCADTVLRLRAEYLRVQDRPEAIAFTYTNGWRSRWSRWAAGFRPRVVAAREVAIHRRAADASRSSFNRYLLDLFSYAGTVSLAREAQPVDASDLAIGDFFVLPGGPGHSVMVLDLAHAPNGQRYALLGQGFMPAQDFHVLRASASSAWYRLRDGQPVDTPMWKPFPWSSLRRLPD